MTIAIMLMMVISSMSSPFVVVVARLPSMDDFRKTEAFRIPLSALLSFWRTMSRFSRGQLGRVGHWIVEPFKLLSKENDNFYAIACSNDDKKIELLDFTFNY